MFLPLIYALESLPEHVYADSGYTGQAYQDELNKDGVATHVCRKGKRNAPLTLEQQLENKKISVVRRIVEFVFAWYKGRARCRRHGLTRVRGVAFINYMVHNIKRTHSILQGRCNIKSMSDLQMEVKPSNYDMEDFKRYVQRMESA